MENIKLFTKLATLPENLKIEVSEFIDSLLNKSKKITNKENKPKAKFGSSKGMFKINADFDEPIKDFKDYV